MALINTLRNKMGKVVVAVIAFSIAAFVGADLLGPNSTLLGNNSTDIGEIAGQTIKLQDFSGKEDEMTYNFRLQSRRNPSASEKITIQNQTWDALVAVYAFTPQFEALGVEVSEDEIIDMVQGDNIAPEIRQAFTNPETGEFDKQQVITFLQSLADQTPEQRANWTNFESNLGPGRRRLKFDNLILKTNFVTEQEGIYEYQISSSTADVNYLYVPYSLSDSVTSTDEELKAYLSENEKEYQREASRSLKYIAIDVIASADDTATVVQEVERLKETLIESDNDSTFALLNTEGTQPFSSYNMDQVPAALQTDNEVVEEGTVVGPVIENGRYVLYKLSAISEGPTYSAKASHILFKWDDDSDAAKAKSKSEARKILADIKGGADFAEMARLHGTDGTASTGGDLGWFAEGRMVDEFEEAVFAARRTGVLRDVVETQFGYHIIDVTGVKTNLQYKVAKIELDIYVSDETRNNYYREAETFALNAKDLKSFDAQALENGYEVKNALRIDKNARRIVGINEARGIVTWLYNTAEIGKVSDAFEIDDQYVIAVMVGEQEKGTADLESVRFEIEKKVKDAKRAKEIKNKLSGLSGTLEEIAEAYGENAKVYNMPSLRLSSNSLTSVGLAPEAVGVAFSLENGETTQPFEVPNGVLIIEMVNKLEPAEVADYQTYIDQIYQRRSPRDAYNVDRTVRDLADIKDERYKFF